MTNERCIVVSGLPASGKSTLARELGARLSLPVVDKDDILEALFDSLGAGDRARRSQLSRAADVELQRLVTERGSVILVSWWRHPSVKSESGTPIDWLAELDRDVVEVHCVCPPAVAAARFATRRRHPGHLDASRTLCELTTEFERLALQGPLECGRVIRVSTESKVDVDEVMAQL